MENGVRTGIGREKRELYRYMALAVLFWLGLYLANYLTVFLQSMGISGSVIGYVSSAAAATGMIGNFVAGRLSDRIGTVKWVTVIAVLLTGGCYLFFPATGSLLVAGMPLALFWWPLTCLFRAPACTMVENWIVRGAKKEGFSYGAARAGGSVGSCVSSVLATLLITALYAVMSQTEAVAATYIVSGALMLICAGYALSVREAGAGAAQKLPRKEPGPGRLFANFRFVMLLLFIFALNVFINPPFVFLPYILSEAGIDTAMLGMIIGWEALLEVPLLFLLVRLQKRFPLPALVIASGVLFAVTTLGQGCSRSLAALFLWGVFFGAANGLNFSCGFNYVYALAPAELKATAHTVYTIASSLGIIVGNMFAGMLVERLGTRPYYYLAGGCTLAVSAAYAVSFLWKPGRSSEEGVHVAG